MKLLIQIDYSFDVGPRERLAYQSGGDAHLLAARAVNFGFWYHLGCFEENPFICSLEDLRKDYTRKEHKNTF